MKQTEINTGSSVSYTAKKIIKKQDYFYTVVKAMTVNAEKGGAKQGETAFNYIFLRQRFKIKKSSLLHESLFLPSLTVFFLNIYSSVFVIYHPKTFFFYLSETNPKFSE